MLQLVLGTELTRGLRHLISDLISTVRNLYLIALVLLEQCLFSVIKP